MPRLREKHLGLEKNVRKFTIQLQFLKQFLLSKMLSQTSVLCKSATDQTRLAVAARWP